MEKKHISENPFLDMIGFYQCSLHGYLANPGMDNFAHVSFILGCFRHATIY